MMAPHQPSESGARKLNALKAGRGRDADVPDLGLTYRWDGTQYIYNWKTDKSMAGYYYSVGVTLDDGRTYNVNVGLR